MKMLRPYGPSWNFFRDVGFNCRALEQKGGPTFTDWLFATRQQFSLPATCI